MKFQFEHILLIFFLLLIIYYLSRCNRVCGMRGIDRFRVGGPCDCKNVSSTNDGIDKCLNINDPTKKPVPKTNCTNIITPRSCNSKQSYCTWKDEDLQHTEPDPDPDPDSDPDPNSLQPVKCNPNTHPVQICPDGSSCQPCGLPACDCPTPAPEPAPAPESPCPACPACPPLPANICLSVTGTVDNKLDGIYKPLGGKFHIDSPMFAMDNNLNGLNVNAKLVKGIPPRGRTDEWIIDAGAHHDLYKKSGDQQLPVGNDWFVWRLTGDPSGTEWESIPELSVTLIYCD